MSLLRFSVFEFDPATPELRRNGRRVPLQDMPLRVLQMLLEHHNELVTRETFFTRLWPHDETGILDDNLNTAVRKLRLALNDSAHHPRFIETVPKRGYRFLAPVAREGETAEPAVPAPPTRPWARMRLAGSLVLAVIAAGALYVFSDGREDAPPRKSADPDTLAVLPFVNAGDNAGDDYFSQGLTEELMDRLARSGGLRVVSRTSAFALKGKNLGAREVGEMLGVGSFVEGSVRREDDRLRISVRLVNARDGYQLWSETYDRRLTDVIDIQEEIAQSIANTLTGRLRGDASTQMPDVPALAYDSYLKGRFYWQRRTQRRLACRGRALRSSGSTCAGVRTRVGRSRRRLRRARLLRLPVTHGSLSQSERSGATRAAARSEQRVRPGDARLRGALLRLEPGRGGGTIPALHLAAIRATRRRISGTATC